MASVPGPEAAEYNQSDGLRHNELAVCLGEQLIEVHSDQRIDHSAGTDDNKTPERDARVSPDCQGRVATASARIDEDREESTHPQTGTHDVQDETVGGVIVTAAG